MWNVWVPSMSAFMTLHSSRYMGRYAPRYDEYECDTRPRAATQRHSLLICQWHDQLTTTHHTIQYTLLPFSFILILNLCQNNSTYITIHILPPTNHTECQFDEDDGMP